jgi:hypothetical protein
MQDGQDIYIRLTKGGKTFVNHHRVWDRDRFFAAQVDQYSGPHTKPEDIHTVSLASKAEYDAIHKRN